MSHSNKIFWVVVSIFALLILLIGLIISAIIELLAASITDDKTLFAK